jgi:hypothetical protein
MQIATDSEGQTTFEAAALNPQPETIQPVTENGSIKASPIAKKNSGK